MKKTFIILLIVVFIALIHVFRLGQILSGKLYSLYYCYFSDLVLPFGAYFLLTFNEVGFPILRQWYAKAGAIMILTSTAEICQLLGIEVLGATFDPLDIACYGVGVLTAALVEVQVFKRTFGFWDKGPTG